MSKAPLRLFIVLILLGMFGIVSSTHLQSKADFVGPSQIATPFPTGPANDATTSLGSFRIVVDPAFRPLLAGYPGYDGTTGKLQSPHLFDPNTIIGRSAPHKHGSAVDTGGTAVGTAGTIIADSLFSLVPPGFQGPNGTNEVHTEVRALKLAPSTNSEFCSIPLTVAVRAGIHAPDRPVSPGEVEAKSTASDFPAESFFDVFVEVDLPAFASFPGGTIFNRDPLLVTNDNLLTFPPHVVYIHQNSNAVPVHFKSDDPGGKWQAGDRFGWLVLAGHGIDFDCSKPQDVQTFDRILAQVPEMKVVTPTVEIDRFESTRALVGIKLPNGTLVNAILGGPATVEVDLASLGDGDNDNLEQVATELVRMELIGSGMTLRAGRDFGLSASKGEIEEKENRKKGRLDLPGPDAPFCTPPLATDCANTQANSFFDVFFDVQVMGQTLHNTTPLRIEALIDRKPPLARYIHVLTQPIELFNAAGQATGIFLVTAQHNTQPEPDHFKCYTITQSEPLTASVFLKDQFGAADARVHDPFVFCNPVRKQHNGKVTPIQNPDAHLKFYQITTSDPGPRIVAVSNQFGAQQVLKVLKPRYLAVPTQKLTPLHPAAKGLDHFKCYEVNGKRIETTVSLVDQFHQEPQVRVLDPVLLCNPTLKRHNNLVTPIRNPDDHLVCYQIDGGTFTRTVQTDNQFGKENLVLGNPRLLCAPSRKTKEVDAFEQTRALVGIRMPDGSLTNLILSGPATVEVDLDSLADASDAAGLTAAPDVPNGLEEVRTELVSMTLSSGGVTLRAGSALGFSPSRGQIEEKVNKLTGRLDLPGPDEPFCTPPVAADCVGTQANSFFDVLFEIEVVGVGKLHNKEALRIAAMIDRKPPKVRYIHVLTQPIQLYDANNNPTQIFLVTAEHNTGPVEVDIFERTSALVGIKLPNGSLLNAVLSGPARVEVDLASLKDAKTIGAPGINGLEEVDTELIQMQLTGSGMTLRAGRLFGLPASQGQIEEKANKKPDRLDLPGPDAPFCTPPVAADCVGTQANSFFDVFFEIDVPAVGKLYNKTPLRIAAMIDKKPPVARYVHVLTQPIELFTAAGNPTGVFLVTAEHNTTPVERDVFTRTVATIQIETPLGRESVRLRGPTTVLVFIDDKTGAATDTDGDGLDQVKTEMTQFQLKGQSSLGPVILNLSTTQPSTGEIEETSNITPGTLNLPPFAITGTAESFFDVWFTLDVSGTVLHNAQAMRMQSRITHKPPGPGNTYRNPFTQTVELVDANGKPTGIKLVKEMHIPNPQRKISSRPRFWWMLVLQTAGGKQTILLNGTTASNLLTSMAGEAEDTDGDGLDQVQIELDQLDLMGVSALGAVKVRLSKTMSSTGEIEEKTNRIPGVLEVAPFAPGSADSFFDVFLEIELPSTTQAALNGPLAQQAQILHTATPVHIQTTLNSQELLENAVYQGVLTQPVVLLDENNQPSGSSLVEGVQASDQLSLWLPLTHR